MNYVQTSFSFTFHFHNLYCLFVAGSTYANLSSLFSNKTVTRQAQLASTSNTLPLDMTLKNPRIRPSTTCLVLTNVRKNQFYYVIEFGVILISPEYE